LDQNKTTKNNEIENLKFHYKIISFNHNPIFKFQKFKNLCNKAKAKTIKTDLVNLINLVNLIDLDLFYQ